MKPDWKDAPEWAQWLAMDRDGKWTWFEDEPIAGDWNIWCNPTAIVTGKQIGRAHV